MHNHVPEIYKPLSLKVYGFFVGIAHRTSGSRISVRVSSVVELDRVSIPAWCDDYPPMHGCFVNRLKRHSFTALGVWTDVVAVLAFFAQAPFCLNGPSVSTEART
jgi:hypothetical protein